MARFAETALLASALAVALTSQTQATPADAESLPVIDGHVTPQEIRALPLDPALKACTDPRCAAPRSLLYSYHTLRRFYTPNTMARTPDNTRSAVRPHLPVQDIADTDAAQRDAISNDLVTIARDVPEWSFELLTIELATLADSSGQILHRVIQSAPKTPAVAGIVESARERCDAHEEHNCRSIISPR